MSKITIKSILEDRFQEFWDKLSYRLPKDMREHIFNVVHRHSVFAIPEELRNYFYTNRGMLKDLMDGVYQVIDYWYKTHKGKSYEVGVIAVIHTFGRNLKCGPHVHALVTEGPINNKYSWWKPVEYIPYEYLRRSWQKVVLDIIKKYFKDYKTRKLISALYRVYKDGFYVNADKAITNMRRATKYIGRYLARAAIATLLRVPVRGFFY